MRILDGIYWATRHGRPHPRDDAARAGTPDFVQPDEPARDDRIAAAMRTYHGPRTKGQR